MRSLQLRLHEYDSDKIANRYLDYYDPMLQPWLEKKIVLLELGVHTGGSLLLWRDYFPMGTIVGVDINLPKAFKPTERIHIFEGNHDFFFKIIFNLFHGFRKISAKRAFKVAINYNLHRRAKLA